MLTFNFNPFPVLRTERLKLRQLTSSDVNEVFFLRSDERVMKYIEKARAKLIEEAFQFIRMVNGLELNNEAITWAIVPVGSEKLAGTICFWNISKENHRGEIGYAMHPDFYGKGIMNEAMQKVLEYGFETMKLHSIMADVSPQNSSSIKLLKKNGFVKEAHIRENLLFEGNYYDTVIYSLLNPKERINNAR